MDRLMVSVDLDDAWAYQRAREIDDWYMADTILPLTGERLINLFEGVGLSAVTAFAVGLDATTSHGSSVLSELHQAGYEIADHSWMHRGELPNRTPDEIHEDLVDSSQAIAEAVGKAPVGFRCPSFGSSENLTAALAELGYAYDSSALPTVLMPVLRAYHRLATRGGTGDAAPTYGSLRTALASQRPKPGNLNGSPAEIPITTMPLLRLPVHGSYLIALASKSPNLAMAYLRTFDRLAHAAQLDVSFLIHPTDILDKVEAPQIGFFPGMAMGSSRKLELLRFVLNTLMGGRRAVRIAETSNDLTDQMA